MGLIKFIGDTHEALKARKEYYEKIQRPKEQKLLFGYTRENAYKLFTKRLENSGHDELQHIRPPGMSWQKFAKLIEWGRGK